jgi:isopenicillin N synthase-like dioxygenase
MSLPILDISRFDAAPAERAPFLADLGAAARDVGFFYLVGHGIAPSRAAGISDAARRFFALPERDKLAIEMVNSPHFRGYNRVGWELTRGRPDWREQIDIGPERPARPAGAGAAPWDRLQGPNQWPAVLPELRPIAEHWIADLTALGIRLLRAFALVLGQPETVFEPIYSPTPNILLKLIRYPGREATQSDQGVGAHKDGGFLTLLYQADQGGLQVEDSNGAWIDAAPLPGSFVVNIGELLELASNGYLKGTLHRAVTPPAGTERLSIGFFLGANMDARVPLLTLPPELADHARGVTRDPSNPLLREVGLNALKSRLRSHPDVARRHHADLLASLNLPQPQAAPSAEPALAR